LDWRAGRRRRSWRHWWLHFHFLSRNAFGDVSEGLLFGSFCLKNAKDKAEREEQNRKADGEFLQNIRRLGTPDLVRDTGTKGSSQAFLLGTLHQHDEHHKKADNNEYSSDDINGSGHKKGRIMASIRE
jgi:hypothetical protein